MQDSIAWQGSMDLNGNADKHKYEMGRRITMKWFYNLKIRVKLLIGFIIVAIIAGIMGVIGITSMLSIDEKDKIMYERMTVGIAELANFNEAFANISVYMRDAINADTQDEIKKNLDLITEARAGVQTSIDIADKTTLTQEGRVLIEKIVAARKVYIPYIDKIAELAGADKDDEALNLLYSNEMVEATKTEQSLCNELADLKEVLAKEMSVENAAAANSSVVMMIIICVIGVLAAILLGLFLSSTICKPLGKIVKAADNLALGSVDVDVNINTNDEVGVLSKSVEKIVKSIKELVAEADMLSRAAVEGRLNTRGNVGRFSGGYKDIIQGVNDTLDAVIGPLNGAADYIDKISRGDIPKKITNSYNGDFNILKNNLNTCIDAVNALVADANMLSAAAVEGRLSTRADVTKHYGDFRKIVQGVNDTLDSVIGPVKDATAILAEMAKGNLNVSVDGDYKGDHALIKNALNNTIATLNDVLNEINTASEQVAAGSVQVSDSSQALSQGSTEQASSIEELTASISEITQQTRKNAANANQANDLAVNAKDNAVQGNKQMQEMLKAMEEINESSVNISKIIKTIDDIAFQTNILALNAAVEAARAGQHGKGFAVVAEEVRNLAAKSANAAKETTALIEGSIKKAEVGTKIAQDTAEALGKIVDGISKAANLVGDIAVASNEQAAGITQVNQGIEQVSDVVQSNSATAEQSASASEELSSQADILKDMVAKFTLKKNTNMFKKLDSLDPEILKALEAMSDKHKVTHKAKSKNPAQEAAAAKMEIKLDDKDFGKY